VRELFDLLNSMQDAAMQQAQQARHRPPNPGPPARDWLIDSQSPASADPSQEIANAVLASATRFIGRAVGKRARRSFDQQIMPNLEARAEQSMRESRLEQDAIVQRHPDLRGCMRDQVIFLAGGTQAVPIADIPMPITLAQADALVGRLRAF